MAIRSGHNVGFSRYCKTPLHLCELQKTFRGFDFDKQKKMKDKWAKQTDAQRQKREYYRCPCVDVTVRIDHWSKVPVVSVHQSLHIGVARIIVDQLHACAIHNILKSSVFNAVPETPHTDTSDFRRN